MKVFQPLTAFAGFALTGVAIVMALTNPSQKAYEEYAMEELATYLKEEICPQAPRLMGNFLQQQCKLLVDSGRPQIEEVIAQKTQRQNLILFSVYHTDLDVHPSLPSYKFETVGVMGSFYIYMYEEQ